MLVMRDIYIYSNLNPLTKFINSSRNIEFKDILPSNISQMITKTVSISMRIVISFAIKQAFPFWVWRKVYGNRDNNMIRISQWTERHCKNPSVRRKKQIQKNRTVRVKVNHLNKVIQDIIEFTRSISSARIGLPVVTMDMKVSKNKHINRQVDWEKLICVRWNRMKNRR